MSAPALAVVAPSAYDCGMVHTSAAPVVANLSGSAWVEEQWQAAREDLGDLGVELRAFRRRVAEIVQAPGAPSPEELVLRDLYIAMGCQAGNERAWRTLQGSLQHHLQRICERATGSAAEGDELLGDLWAELVQREARPGKIQLYRGLASLSTWLAAIVRRMAIDRQRRRQRRRLREERHGEGLHERSAPSPEAGLLQAEAQGFMTELLPEAMGGLEARERLVLRLSYWDGLTLREVGQVMGLDFSTVSRRLKNARESLRRSLRRAYRSRGLPAEELGDLVSRLGHLDDLKLPREAP